MTDKEKSQIEKELVAARANLIKAQCRMSEANAAADAMIIESGASDSRSLADDVKAYQKAQALSRSKSVDK